MFGLFLLSVAPVSGSEDGFVVQHAHKKMVRIAWQSECEVSSLVPVGETSISEELFSSWELAAVSLPGCLVCLAFPSAAYIIVSFYRLLLGTLYPAYSSYKAIRTKNVDEYVINLNAQHVFHIVFYIYLYVLFISERSNGWCTGSFLHCLPLQKPSRTCSSVFGMFITYPLHIPNSCQLISSAQIGFPFITSWRSSLFYGSYLRPLKVPASCTASSFIPSSSRGRRFIFKLAVHKGEKGKNSLKTFVSYF